MKMQINGVEITPKMAEVIGEWYNQDTIENTQPYIYARWLSKVQDYLTRNLIDMDDDDDNLPVVKECLNMTVTIKDDFDRLIPARNEPD